MPLENRVALPQSHYVKEGRIRDENLPLRGLEGYDLGVDSSEIDSLTKYERRMEKCLPTTILEYSNKCWMLYPQRGGSVQ